MSYFGTIVVAFDPKKLYSMAKLARKKIDAAHLSLEV
jgi:hypothetical protein